MSTANVFGFNLTRALEVFNVVVETQQVSRAAELLGISQSAVSQTLQKLEQALGASLIERNARPLQLTKAGIVLHRRAISVLAEIEQLQVEIRRVNTAPLPVLRIALLASIATTLSPALTGLARNDFGIPEISLSAGLSIDHQNLLRNRRADLAISSDAFYLLDGLVRYPILREKFLLVTPQHYDGPIDDLSALARNLPLVHFARDSLVGRRTDQHLSRLRLELPRAMEGDRSSVVLAPVAAGQGFAILTPTLLLDGLAEGMKIDVHPLPVASFSREIVLVARDSGLDELPAVFAAESTRVLTAAINDRLPDLPADSFVVEF